MVTIFPYTPQVSIPKHLCPFSSQQQLCKQKHGLRYRTRTPQLWDKSWIYLRWVETNAAWKENKSAFMVSRSQSLGVRVDKAWIVGSVSWCRRVLKRNFRMLLVWSVFLLVVTLARMRAIWYSYRNAQSFACLRCGHENTLLRRSLCGNIPLFQIIVHLCGWKFLCIGAGEKASKEWDRSAGMIAVQEWSDRDTNCASIKERGKKKKRASLIPSLFAIMTRGNNNSDMIYDSKSPSITPAQE